MADEFINRLTIDMGDSGTQVQKTAQEVDKLRGQGGQGGYGILGASYAAQDFISVLQFGGGWGRALGSAANNVTALAMAMGAGAGLAGGLTVVTALASAGISIIEKWWKAAGDEKAADEAKGRIDEITKSIEKANEAFEKLRQAATPGEEDTAKRITDFLKQRPHADEALAALMPTIGAPEALGALTPEQQQAFTRAQRTAARGRRILAEPGAVPVVDREAFIAQQQAEIAANEAEMGALLARGRRARGAGIIGQAQVAGPAGEAARRQVVGAVPELEIPPLTREEQARIEAEGRRNARQFEREQEREREGQAREQMQARQQVQQRIPQDIQRRNRALQGQAEDEARGEQVQQRQEHERQRRDRAAIQAETRRQEAGDRANRDYERRRQATIGAETAAHQDFIRAVQGSLSAQEQRVQMWRAAAAAVRQRTRTNQTTGLPGN